CHQHGARVPTSDAAPDVHESPDLTRGEPQPEWDLVNPRSLPGAVVPPFLTGEQLRIENSETRDRPGQFDPFQEDAVDGKTARGPPAVDLQSRAEVTQRSRTGKDPQPLQAQHGRIFEVYAQIRVGDFEVGPARHVREEQV